MKRAIVTLATILLAAGVCHAGWLDDAIRRTGEGLGRRAVDEAGSGAYDKGKQGAKGAVEIIFRADMDDPKKIAARTKEYEERFLSPFIAAERGYIDGRTSL